MTITNASMEHVQKYFKFLKNTSILNLLFSKVHVELIWVLSNRCISTILYILIWIE